MISEKKMPLHGFNSVLRLVIWVPESQADAIQPITSSINALPGAVQGYRKNRTESFDSLLNFKNMKKNHSILSFNVHFDVDCSKSNRQHHKEPLCQC
jgi:hypothetical protein